MPNINLQSKTQAKKGQVEMYWFENEFTGLKRTLFHRITIPLTAFDSELEYEAQPVETEIVIDWLILNLINPNDLGNLTISSQDYKEMEASVYIGGVHNWCDVNKLTIERKEDETYTVKGELSIDFEAEGVAESEVFSFQTSIKYPSEYNPWNTTKRF
jgi:hypothetical protein